MRGAFIHYSTEKRIPLIKNVVLFQFSSQNVEREFIIPSKDLKTETKQSGTEPVEKISFTAHFDASDLLNKDDEITKLFGIGPQLAALEKLVYPITKSSSVVGFVLDKVGSLIPNKEETNVTIPQPREKYPQLLLVWGLTRILPVEIISLRISELRYDKLMMPLRAEVNIALGVIQENDSMDIIARGALKATNTIKDSIALVNFGRTGIELGKAGIELGTISTKAVAKETSDIVQF